MTFCAIWRKSRRFPKTAWYFPWFSNLGNPPYTILYNSKMVCGREISAPEGPSVTQDATLLVGDSLRDNLPYLIGGGGWHLLRHVLRHALRRDLRNAFRNSRPKSASAGCDTDGADEETMPVRWCTEMPLLRWILSRRQMEKDILAYAYTRCFPVFW